VAEVEGTEKSDRIGVGSGSRGVRGVPSEEADSITGQLGNDRIDAGGGADWVWADRSGSLAVGRTGSDTVLARAGEDVLFGDAEILTGSARGGRDLLDGGQGDDTILGDAALLRERTRGGADLMLGGPGADLIHGDGRELREEARGGADRLLGGEGDDRLFGDALFFDPTARPGRDTLDGGAGDDLLYGGGGGDDLTGGGGADLFVLSPAPGLTRILDFEPDADRLDVALAGLDFARLDGDGNGRIDGGDPFVAAGGGGLRLDLGAAAGGPVGEVVVLLLGVRELGSSDVVAEFILPAS
jgi:Ca2+-binding RTX toxin-like protein